MVDILALGLGSVDLHIFADPGIQNVADPGIQNVADPGNQNVADPGIQNVANLQDISQDISPRQGVDMSYQRQMSDSSVYSTRSAISDQRGAISDQQTYST